MLLIGHRGAADSGHPENTLAAVDRALRQGADGDEVDVRLTADGIPVVHHDAGLRRTAGDPRHIASVDFAELPRIAGHQVPRLTDVLDLVAGRGHLVVELKTPHWPAGAATDTVEAVVAVLRPHRLDDVTVSSFDRPRILRVRESGLPVRTALLGRVGVPFGVTLRRALADGHVEVQPHIRSLAARLDLVAAAHAHGLTVSGWTVERPVDLIRCAAAGVDAAICDDPRAAVAVLDRQARLAQAG